ncbi:unnamed protein product [[Candida] boidinii]|nr:unnamed protein product [[Candida] boidinii]
MLLFGTLLFSTIGKNKKDKESEIFLKSMKPDNEPTPTSQEKNSSITIKSKTTDKHIKKAAITPVPKTESSEQKPIADNDSDIPLSKHSVSQTEKSSHEDAFTTKPEQKTELQSENKTDKNNYAALLLQTAAKK